MYEIGDFVVFGNKGVCKIINVGSLDMPGISKDRVYYTMSQVSQKDSIIYTPIDKEDSPIRNVLDKKEANEILELFKTSECDWITNDKTRNKYFTEVLRRADARELTTMMVSLERRRKERISEGKKPTSTDERFFHGAADIIYEELSIALNRKKEKIKELVEASIN